MPRKKRSVAALSTVKAKVDKRRQKSKKQQKPVKVSRLRQMIRSVRWTDSYTSLLMGVIVVVVAVLFVVSFLKQTHHVQQTSSISTIAPSAGSASSAPSELSPSTTERTYTVKAGDDLWHIAEKFYKSGYNWVDIAKANNLSDPNMVFSGNVLIIPKVAPALATVTVTPTPGVGSTHTITGSTYTVQKGDNLWDIAVRAYADGYQWTKIAQANTLSNPNLIFSGNVLRIPR